MPELCRFFGIVIMMNRLDHPPPHFHVKYQEYEATIRIDNFGLHDGDLPARQLGRVVEWAKMHRAELWECWRLSRLREPLLKIKPLGR